MTLFMQKCTPEIDDVFLHNYYFENSYLNLKDELSLRDIPNKN